MNEVHCLYYGILPAESGRRSLQTTADFLKQLDQDTGRNVVQRVAVQADSLDVKAQLAQAEFALLKLEDPLKTQQQLNRVMGRDPDTPFEVDPLGATDFEMPDLKRAYAIALELRPEVRIAQLQGERAALDRRLKSAERIPDVSLAMTSVATVNLSPVLPNRLSVIGVQVAWDVYDWGRKRKQTEEKRFAAASTPPARTTPPELKVVHFAQAGFGRRCDLNPSFVRVRVSWDLSDCWMVWLFSPAILRTGRVASND